MRMAPVVSTFTAVVLAAALLSGCVSGLSRDESQKAAQTNAQLGLNYLQRGELQQARGVLDKALQQDDENALVHAAYAQLQDTIGEDDTARYHFKEAIRLDPDEAAHKNAYGAFLCGAGEIEAAEAEFLLAAVNPFYQTPEFAYDNAGLCMLEAQRLDQAEKYLRKALQVNPRFPAAFLHMAELLHVRDRLTVADAYYQRYEALAEPTAESLMLGHMIKRDAGDIASAERYAGQLLNDFPASREAGEYLARPLN